MKKFSTQIIIISLTCLIVIILIGNLYIYKEFDSWSKNSVVSYHLIKDTLIVIAYLFFTKLALNQIHHKYKSTFEKFQKNNAEITESKERYDIVAKATSDTIWDWQLKSDRVIWNKGIQGVFGYKKNEVGNDSNWWFSRIHPEDSLNMSVKLYSFIDTKTEKWQREYRFQCADGSFKHVLDRGFLLTDTDGNAVRMIGAIQDITQRKEEEQRLKLLETAITQSKDAILIADTEIIDAYTPKIIFVNNAFQNMTGYEEDEILTKSIAILFGSKSCILQLDILKNAVLEYKECIIETICYKKTGEEFWINLSMIPVMTKDGEHSHWISIMRDITEEKEKIKEREQLIRELTQNNNDLKQFSYITSHNLRAPLSNLTGLLNLVDDIEIKDEELKEIIDGFATSTQLLNETINDLVKVVIIKDNPSIKKEIVPIKEIFENVFNQLSFLISLHKPILKIELDDITISNMNKSYLESIFLNLLTNSIKYKSPNRQLKITVTSKIVNNKIILSFKDNGIGIDLERNKHKIFGLYQRFHNHPDSKGLGLYLVKSQVETMGGTITVDSTVDKGTTFTITFNN